MLDYPALSALSQVIRRGSFEAAASALGVTQSAISQRIRSLEERMGAVLIHRGTPPTATEVGAQLIAHFDRVMLLESGLNQGTADTAAVIRIAVNADSLASWAMPALAAAPGLVDLVIDDQDHADQWLRAGRVTAAITGHPGPVPGCDSLMLGAMRYQAVASPTFIARHFANGVTAEAMARAPMLTFNTKDRLQLRWLQKTTGQRLSPPTHLVPSAEAFAAATRLGIGWGMNPDILIAEDLITGRLVPLLPDTPLNVALHWQVTRITAEALRPLTKAIQLAASQSLQQVSR